MININGLYKFRDFFEKYTDNYVLIGGTACSVLFDEVGEDFRATKDLDVVLIAENISDDFAKAFWNFIREADYKIESTEEKRQFYRFKDPKSNDYPKMIELFSRKEKINLFPHSHLTPIHISDDVSSLSAILLDDDYYSFLISGKRIVEGFSILDEKYLIPFKAKAWCDLNERRKKGEEGNSRHIKKHYRDIFRLLMLLPENEKVVINEKVKKDMGQFIDSISELGRISEDIDHTFMCRKLRDIFL